MNQEQALFKVDRDQAGKRVDVFLSQKLNHLSRSRIAKLIEQKKILINQQTITKSDTLKAGDLLAVVMTDQEDQPVLKPQKLHIHVVYEDEHLSIVSKPPGMVCYPGPGHHSGTLANALLYKYKKLPGFREIPRTGLVHRLDKDTSGLLIVAKDEHTHTLLQGLFKKRLVKKNYTALSAGLFSEKRGRIALPLARSSKDRKKISVSVNRGREALTEFRRIQSYGSLCSLLDINLKTGRTHQIRVHLHYIGHPVVGDRQYGNKASLKIAKEIGIKRHFLHARKLEFTHPVTQEHLRVEDVLPPDLQAGLDNLARLVQK